MIMQSTGDRSESPTAIRVLPRSIIPKNSTSTAGDIDRCKMAAIKQEVLFYDALEAIYI